MRSPDGRDWEVTIQRARLPSWRHSGYEPESDDLLFGLVETLVVAPVLWFVVPLLRLLAELPLAIGRSFFSSTRWVEAQCQTPGEVRTVWRTSRRRAEKLADELVERLGKGYDDLAFARGTRISMTTPPGFGDLES